MASFLLMSINCYIKCLMQHIVRELSFLWFYWYRPFSDTIKAAGSIKCFVWTTRNKTSTQKQLLLMKKCQITDWQHCKKMFAQIHNWGALKQSPQPSTAAGELPKAHQIMLLLDVDSVSVSMEILREENSTIRDRDPEASSNDCGLRLTPEHTLSELSPPSGPSRPKSESMH